MDDIVLIVSEHISTFCKVVPAHVEKWRTIVAETTKLVRGVANLAEQLRYVHDADLTYKEDFVECQKKLKHKIIIALEEDLIPIKTAIDKLNKINHDLRNKLVMLENSTLNLDWNEDLDVVKGSATIPALSRLLQAALNYWNFFQAAHRNINDCFKNMDWFDEKNMISFEEAFKIDLDNKVVLYLLSITQYVDNEENIV